jgi:DNA-binding MarR family transcriptional regulator
MSDVSRDGTPVGVRLAMAIKRLRTRLREVAPSSSIGLPISQLSILQRLRTDGPATASSLAAAEHVSQQAIAQNLAALKHARLVQARPDPADNRKSLISVTAAGRRLFETAINSRNAWLVQAIESTIGVRERPALEKAVELLERLADADVPAR